MRRLFFLLMACLLGGSLLAQEQLAPLRMGNRHRGKLADSVRTLPFFDDFSKASAATEGTPWLLQGALVNQGYDLFPPTLGMVTLDAYDAEGRLYPATVGDLYYGDTLTSPWVRLDSLFEPYARALTVGDSIYLSFYYLPGGGSGNMWERIGDSPDPQDSLVLEFYNPRRDCWQQVWGRDGVPVDTLLAQTGCGWQYVQVPITDSVYLQSDFRFRFRNYCSLDNMSKPGLLGNADQWNVDYILLDVDRRAGDRFTRDVAFVTPATSLLRQYQAMPASQFQPSDMADSISVTITNLFSQELAANYGYRVLSSDGRVLHNYEGGLDNVPVFWPAQQYQSAPGHASPSVDFVFPVQSGQPESFSIVHGVREGVSGDGYPQNDTIRFVQVFDDYYAYDDGFPENGYGITSTGKPQLACRFNLHVEDTLTAVDLYFNRTYSDGNAGTRFLLTVWDDDDGRPGNIIYQDEQRRRPQFQGFNQYVRYVLEAPLVCDGIIYVGLEQTSSDYLNIGFDRNCDASQHLFYLTGVEWQRSILRGALMLRPYFGSRALVGVEPAPATPPLRVIVKDHSVYVENAEPNQVRVYDLMGRQVAADGLRPGIYLVRVGSAAAQKVVVF